MNIPVVFVIYNRPELTKAVMRAIRARRPSRLIVVADGPKRGDADDEARCRAARAAALEVDWRCAVETDFADQNLGCAVRVSSGLSNAFRLCDAAVILEDDTIPSADFFRFAEELLHRFADDERIFTVSGSNFLFRDVTAASYYFSRFPNIWGWATWARAWRHYDHSLAAWTHLRDSSWLVDLLGELRAAAYWRRVFDQTLSGGVDSWAYRWFFTAWRHSALAVIPRRNLVTNVGFGAAATHTNSIASPLAAVPRQRLSFPLNHPPAVERHEDADQFMQRVVFERQRLLWLRRGVASIRGVFGGSDAR